MDDTTRKENTRRKWLKIYEETGSVTKTALRCGIARSTLYRWLKRQEHTPDDRLSDKSHRPKNLAKQKVTPTLESKILDIREKRKWGAARISTHLLRVEKVELSPMTVWRVLKAHNVKPVAKRRKKSDYILYNKEIPGDRVQMDVTKLRAKAYQFTAIDDCTRLKTIRVYPNKKAESTIDFLYEVLRTFPFPILHLQTDWGTEFFNDAFQEELHAHYIKYRPIKPRTPHLNGKVERTQQTDKTEFWSCFDLSDQSLDLNALAMEWQEFYNKKRPHSSLRGLAPWQKLLSVEHLISDQYDFAERQWNPDEQVMPRNYEYLKFLKKNNLSPHNRKLAAKKKK